MAEPAHRSGVVALLGLPNAGKSTLLNRWIGEKLSAVAPRPQTTRSRILGILSRPGVQALVVDTPGLVARRRALENAMADAVEEAAGECDVAVLLVDLGKGWTAAHEALRDAVRAPVLVVGTKADRHPHAVLPEAAHHISARSGEGVERLLDDVLGRLPDGPPFYPEDQLTDRPLRFLAAEQVREAAFHVLAEEVPYGIAVEVEEFDESRPDLVRIRANLLVERRAHKPIVVGAGGAQIRRIGIRARREIERLLGGQVHLELWVKVERDWAKRPKRLKSLGYF